MTQWVKNPTAVAQVVVEAWVRSPAQCSGLKDLAAAWIQFLTWEFLCAMGAAKGRKEGKEGGRKEGNVLKNKAIF